MRKRSAVTVAMAVGLSLWSCSDEKPGPGVGPNASWQILCADALPGAPADPTDSCSTSEDPHGPLDGMDLANKSDDYELDVSCSRMGSGLAITIEDPGRKVNVDRQQSARARSVLSITRADPANNTCIVAVTEYPLDKEPIELKVQDSCRGNSSAPGSCVFEGEFDANDYAFEGTLQCDGLRYKGQGPAAWAVRAAAPNNAQPVKLQIARCD